MEKKKKKICVDLCLSVVEKMDFLQPAEALPANGRGKRPMAKQARGRGRYRSRYRGEAGWDWDTENRVEQPC